MAETDWISRQDAIDIIDMDKMKPEIAPSLGSTAERDFKIYNHSCNKHIELIKQLPSAQTEHPLLKIIQDFKEMTGCEDVIVVQKDAMKAWDENGVAYTMQPERKGEWVLKTKSFPLAWDSSPSDYDNYDEETHSELRDYYYCSECGWKSGEFKGGNFCPNCGAMMLRGDDNG